MRPGPDRSTAEAGSIRASIVLVTYNSADYIRRCLSSVFATIGQSDEVIVVDNASHDGTTSIVANEFPEARQLNLADNRGFGGANNLAAAVARGEYLVLVNPDTEQRPGWIEALLEALRGDKGIGLATAKVLLMNAPGTVDTIGNHVHVSGITTSRGWGLPDPRRSGIEDVPAVSGACLAVSATLYRWLGGFDERLFLYYEDTDLSLRARLAGLRCVAAHGAEVLHDHQPGFSPMKLRYLERNRWWTMLKLYRPASLVALTPVLLGGELLAWALAATRGRQHVAAKLAVWGDLLRWLPALPAARAAAQRGRRVSDGALLLTLSNRLPISQVARSRGAVLAERALEVAFGIGSLPARLLVRA